MPTHDGSRGLRFVRALLGSLQSTLRRRAAGAAALWAAAGVLASLAVLLLVDAAIGFPGSARPVIYLVAWLAGVTVVAAAVGRAWARRPSASYVARLIEAERPDLKNALITLVELQDAPQADPTMAAALGRRAARLLADAEPRMFLPPAALRRPATAAAGAALMLVSGLWLAQGILFAPWVTAAEAGPVVSLTGGPVGGGAPRPASGQAPLAGLSQQSGQPRGHATQASGEAGANGSVPQPVLSGRAESGAAGDSPQALAAELKADAATFDRLAAALGIDAGASAGNGASGAGASRGEAAGRGTPRPANAGDRGANQTGATPGGGALSRPDRSARSDAGQGSPTSAGREPSAGRDASKPGTPAGDGAAMPRSREGAAESPSKSPPQGTGSRGQNDGGAPATAHDGAGQGGGGDARSDSAFRPRPGNEPPLPKRKPGEDFPAEVLDSMHRAERIIKKAEERLREGEVTDAMLQQMGMTNAQFRRFVTSWQRKFETSARGLDAVAVPLAAGAAADASPGRLLRPGQGSAVPPVTGETRGPDGRKGLVQGSDSQVSPHLRPAVDGYFEAVGRRAVQAAGEDAGK